MRRASSRIPRTVGIVGTCIFVGCGPNVQMIYEGNVRFEHCYRLDLDPNIAPSHRHVCWKDWLTRHTYGQTGDRLAHARQRLSALDRGDQATLSMQVDAGTQLVQSSNGVPMPTSIHSAPPPKAIETQPVASVAPIAVTPVAPPLDPPEKDCANACKGLWNDCAPSCSDMQAPSVGGDAANSKKAAVAKPSGNKNKPKPDCVICSKTFKSCMKRCFR